MNTKTLWIVLMVILVSWSVAEAHHFKSPPSGTPTQPTPKGGRYDGFNWPEPWQEGFPSGPFGLNNGQTLYLGTDNLYVEDNVKKVTVDFLYQCYMGTPALKISGLSSHGYHPASYNGPSKVWSITDDLMKDPGHFHYEYAILPQPDWEYVGVFCDGAAVEIQGDVQMTYDCIEWVEGDYNVDGNPDGTSDEEDIDVMNHDLGNPAFDLDGDGDSDQQDVDCMVHDLIGTEYGDANLDYAVNVGDLGILGANYDQIDKGWGSADFNGDGMVDVGDLGILGAHYDWSAGGGAAVPELEDPSVPEPASLSLLALGALALIRRRRPCPSGKS